MQKVEQKNQGQSTAPHYCPGQRTSKIKAFQLDFGVRIGRSLRCVMNWRYCRRCIPSCPSL